MKEAMQRSLQLAKTFAGSTRSYLALEQQLDAESLRPIFDSLIQTLLKLVEMKNKGKGENPFEADPGKMLFFIACLLLLGVAYGFNKWFSSPLLKSISIRAMMLSGSMAVATLASDLLSPPSFQWLPYTAYILLAMGGYLYTLAGPVFEWIRQIGGRTEAALPEESTGSEI